MSAGKPAQPAGFSQLLKVFVPTGEELVRIALVANVPQQSIVLEIKDVVQGNGQFRNAEVTGQMAAVFAHNVDDTLTDLAGYPMQRGRGQFAEILRATDLV
jgi:hypothetical protein